MNKIIMAVALLGFGAFAHAGGIQIGDDYVNNKAQSSARASATAGAVAVVSTRSHQSQGQLQGQGQHQSADNAGNRQSTSLNFEDRRQAPALGGLASGDCTGAGGGLVLPGGGFNVATLDDECGKREAYRLGIISPDADIQALAKKVYLSLEAVQAVMVKATPTDKSANSGDKFASNEQDAWIAEYMK